MTMKVELAQVITAPCSRGCTRAATAAIRPCRPGETGDVGARDAARFVWSPISAVRSVGAASIVPIC